MPPSSSSASRRAASGVMPGAEVVVDVQLQMALELGRRDRASRRVAAETPAQAQSQARSVLMTAAPDRQEPRQDRGRPLPVARFLLELLAPGARQAIELGLAVVVRHAPFGGDVALLLELEQGGIERAVVEREMVARWSARCAGRSRSRAAARASPASSAPSAPACPARRRLSRSYGNPRGMSHSSYGYAIGKAL